MDKSRIDISRIDISRIIAGFLIAAFLVLGYVTGQSDIWSRLFPNQSALYFNPEANVSSTEFTYVDWQQLLGEQDKQLFADLRRQQETVQRKMASGQMEADLLLSALKANTWNALDGYEINQNVADKWSKIPGFIVPLEADQQLVSSFFIVPYFGACLHFPPPPPNQIIYVDLPQGIEVAAIDTPLLFWGKLTSELFEEPLGTSAWTMEVIKIHEYRGDADATRLHQ